MITANEILDFINDLQRTPRGLRGAQRLVSLCPCALDLCPQAFSQYMQDPAPSGAVERRAALPGPRGVLQQLCSLSWPLPKFAQVGTAGRFLPFPGTPEHLAWPKTAVFSFQLLQMGPLPSGLRGRSSCIPDSQRSPDAACPPVQGGERAPQNTPQVESKRPSPGWEQGPWLPRSSGTTSLSVHQPQAEALDAPRAAHHVRDTKASQNADTEGITADSGEFGDKVFIILQTVFPLYFITGTVGKRSVEGDRAEDSLPSVRPAVCCWRKRRARGLKTNFSNGCLKTQEHLQIQRPFPSTFLRLGCLPQTIEPVMKTSATNSPQNDRSGEQPQLSEAAGASLTKPEAPGKADPLSSREEEVASELHLSDLLEVVDI
ncbi:hypothetical protein HPG69_014158 [Diceros bicornis minor]|uniref:Germinal-centre associated nuclear protein MCM3AP domain-containing protein n=1 Tax=Diceros bicornis minor TaxID=77932 RepID=A0A7J7FIY2_DICBM|nr:hypothetical protein HPG69_014158 [Diceros bicornis minor]